jgi:hypothetical protein
MWSQCTRRAAMANASSSTKRYARQKELRDCASEPSNAGDANSRGILSPSLKPESADILRQFSMNCGSESREDPAHFNALPPQRFTAAAITVASHLTSSGALTRKEPRHSIHASFEPQPSPRRESSGASLASEIAPSHFDTSSAFITVDTTLLPRPWPSPFNPSLTPHQSQIHLRKP